MKARNLGFAGAMLLAACSAALAGEVIGNTYIGEKHGYIEVLSPEGKWSIKDKEGEGTGVVELRLKDPINGTNPSVLVQAIPHSGGLVPADMVLQIMRDSFAQQGMQTGPVETGRIAGKKVYQFWIRLERSGQVVKGDVVMCEGDKSFFMIQFTANSVAYDAARPLFNDVLEKVKYGQR